MARKTEVIVVPITTDWARVETPSGAVAMSIAGDGAITLSISFDGGDTEYPFLSAEYHFQKKLNGIQVFYLKGSDSGSAYVLFDREV